VNPTPTITVSQAPAGAICANQTKVLTASGAASYSWSPAANLSATNVANPTFGPAAAGSYTYTVTGTAANGCTATATVTITVNAIPTITVSQSPAGAICVGQTKVLTASGAASYSWSPAANLSATNVANPTFGPAAAGSYTYTVTGTAANGCTATTTVTVTVNNNPTISVAGSTTVCANQSTVLTASGAATYLWSPSTNLSLDNVANPTFGPAAAGSYTYTVTGTAANGCTATATVTITVNATPTITVSQAPAGAICAGQTKVLTASGAASYSWSPATNLSATNVANPTFGPAAAGSYTYTVTGTAANGCTATATVTVTVNANPTITVSQSPAGAICAGQTKVLTASGAASYSWSPAANLSATNVANPTFGPAAAGSYTYTVTGTAANGCTATATVTVTVNPSLTLAVNGTTTVCEGAAINLTASGATTYNWTDGTNTFSGANLSTIPSATTTYTVTGTASGCTGSTTVLVTVNPLPVLNVTGTTDICPGQSTTLTASGADVYTWSPTSGLTPSFGAVVSASPSVGTTYTVTGINATTGCSNQITVTVNVLGAPSVNASNSGPVCSGATVTLNAAGSGITGFSWSPAVTGTGASVTANPTVTTVYTVTATAANGCTTTATTTVTVNPAPNLNISATPAAICPGGASVLTASGATSYSWAGPSGSLGTAASINVAPVTTTTYTLTGTAAGCTATAVFTLTVNAQATISASASLPTVCVGGTSILTATGGASYSWAGPSGALGTGASISVSPTASSTTYTVTGTDSNGCTGTATVTVAVAAQLSLTPSANPAIICGSGSTVLSATGATSYTWQDASGIISGQTPTVSPTTTTTYTVTGTDGAGCTATATLTVAVNPSPVVSVLGSGFTICSGTSETLTASGADTYSWTDGTNTFAGGTVTVNPAATTTYTVTGTSNGCTATAEYTVDVFEQNQITVSAAANPVCSDNSAILTATTTVPGVLFTWDGPNGFQQVGIATVAVTTVNPSTTNSITVTYTVTVDDANGCKSSTTFDLVVRPRVDVTVTPASGSVCPGESITLTASGTGVTYQWAPTNSLDVSTGTTVVASPTVNTTYTVKATDQFGCVNQFFVPITVNPAPVVAVSGITILCEGQSTTLTASGATSYTWFDGTTTLTGAIQTITPAATTTYTVTGTDGNSCSATTTVTVTVNALPAEPQVAPVPNICEGSDIIGTLLNTEIGVNYSLNGNPPLIPGTGGDIQVPLPTGTLAPGTYPVTVVATNAAGCSSSTTGQLVVVPLPTITVSGTTTYCAGGSTVLTAAGADDYTWFDGITTLTGAIQTLSPSVTTTYTVTGTELVNNCSNTTTVTITVNPLPTITTSGDVAICTGQSTTLTAAGAVSYTWFDGTNNFSISPLPVSPTVTTTYTVTGVDANDCVNTATVTVTVNPLPTVSASAAPAAICLGQSTTLTGSGATTYSWTDGTATLTGTSVSVSPAATTTYTVTGADGNSCSNTATVTVTVNPLPTVSASAAPATICAGQSTTLTAAGASTYTWTDGTTTLTGASVNVSPAATTTYTVTGVDGNNCSNTATVTVTVNPLPTVSASAAPAAICTGQSTTLTAAGATTYSWTDGTATLTGTSVSVSPAATTTYTVTGVDGNNCSNTATVTVTVNPLPTVSASAVPAAICVGQSTTLTAAGASTYTWTDGTTTLTGASVSVSPAATTTYTVTGVDGNNCSNTATVTVTVNPLPTLTTATPSVVLCIGQSTALTVATDPGLGSAVTWAPAIGLNTTTGTTVTANPTVTTTYTVSVTNANGCVNTLTITINVKPLPTVTASTSAGLVCVQTPFTLTATGADNYIWNPGNIVGAVVTIDTLTLNTVYTVTGFDVDGCSNTATVAVNVLTKPLVVTTTPAPICAGASVAVTAFGAVSYTWTPSAGLTVTSPSGNAVTLNPSSTTTYIVTGTNAAGCTNTAAVVVEVKPIPVVNLTANQTAVCAGQSITLVASGGTTYQWAPVQNAGSGSTISVSPTQNTTYTVTGIDQFGCSATATIAIEVAQPFTVQAEASANSICFGAEVVLSVIAPVAPDLSYIWAPIGVPGQSITASPQVSTTYTVTVVNAAGCANTATVFVSVLPPPVVSIQGQPATAVCKGTKITLTASGGTDYVWTPGELIGASIEITADVNQVYTVTALGANGCANTATASITVSAPPDFTITRSAPALCIGSTTGIVLNIVPADGATQYSWQPTVGLSSGTGVSVLAQPPTTTIYTVTATKNSCSTTQTVEVTVKPLPPIDIIVSDPTSGNLCDGETAILRVIYTPRPDSVPVGYQFQWFNDVTGAQIPGATQPTLSVTQDGRYRVEVRDFLQPGNTSCNASDVFEVVFRKRPEGTIEVIGDTDYCAGDSVVLYARPTRYNPFLNRYQWYRNGIALFPAPGQYDSLVVKTPGTYSLEALDSVCNFVVQFGSVQVNERPKPLAQFNWRRALSKRQDYFPQVGAPFEPLIFRDSSLARRDGELGLITAWLWEFGDDSVSFVQNPTHVYRDTGEYRVRLTVVNEFGCTDTTSRIVRIVDGVFVIPNAFSPNNDNNNELFVIHHHEIASYTMFIYDRWGNKVWENRDQNVYWNGRINNTDAECPQGVYVYYIRAEGYDGEIYNRSGSITLLR
jgi:gliding motility-associated-like protein